MTAQTLRRETTTPLLVIASDQRERGNLTVLSGSHALQKP